MGIADISLVKADNPGPPVVGLLYTPDKPLSYAVVLGHGYSGSKQDMASLAQALCSAGHYVLAPDARGHKLGSTGGSMGSLDDISEDLETCVRFVKRETGTQGVILCGHSMGGGAVAKTAAVCDDVAAVILLAIGVRPLDIPLPPKAMKLTELRSKYVVGTSALEARHQIQIMLREYVPEIPGTPLLVIYGKDDRFNTAEYCQNLIDLATGPKALTMVNTDHFGVPLRCAGEVVEWLAEQGLGD